MGETEGTGAFYNSAQLWCMNVFPTLMVISGKNHQFFPNLSKKTTLIWDSILKTCFCTKAIQRQSRTIQSCGG